MSRLAAVWRRSYQRGTLPGPRTDVSDRYPDAYEDDYLSQLEANMEDPQHAQVARCAVCGHRCAFRVWPASGHRTLEAFVGGLLEADELTGHPCLSMN